MNWYDNIEKDDSLTLPVVIGSDNEYLNKLNKLLETYENKLISINVEKDIINQIKEFSKLILDCIDKYFKGNIEEARENLKNILRVINEEDELIVCDLNKSFGLRGFNYFENIPKDDIDSIKGEINEKIPLFKARVSDSIVEFDAYDMLHIPFDKRDIVKTQRFSIPGLPCMYFGTSSYVCWLELNKPLKSQFNVSEFEILKNFKILNLISSWSMISELSKKKSWNYSFDKHQIIKELMLIWPLVCATSFRVKEDKDRQFKSEYIISQLLMQIINSIRIDGICYYSKRIPFDAYAFPYCVNLALPAKYTGESKISNICKYIKIRKPVNFEEYTMLKDDRTYKYKRECVYLFGSGVLLAQLIDNYSNTKFYDFDMYLREQIYMDFNVNDFNKEED
ncbi:hypothetical protein KYB31_05550 [Clostridium felsineum]|uniref:hypothetical protein n=1 Tax=Clostridium felsineum TaxID=36839 RepID=UPI00214D37E8|nr:hypothetical protein [Clostridium felsineum]MCR3758460.1 hypothetical protein [Clostridium felsineum]